MKIIKTKFYYLLLAVLCIAGLIYAGNLNNYSLCCVLLVVAIYFFYCKTNFYFNKRVTYRILLLSVFLSLLYSMGNVICMIINDANLYFVSSFFCLKTLILIFSYSVIFFILIYNIFQYLYNYNFFKKFSDRKWKMIIINMVLLILLWLPYIISNYPAIITSDGIDQIYQVFGINPLNNHHPVVHTLLLKLIILSSNKLIHNMNICVFLVCIFQIVIMSFLFSYIINVLYRFSSNKVLVILCILFYGFFPLFGIFSMSILKDTLFSCLFLLFNYELFLIYNKELTIKHFICFSLLNLLFCLLRSNAIYVFFITFIFLIVKKYEYRKNLVISLFLTLIMFIFVKVPVFNYYNVYSSSIKESLAIPIQQVSRIIYKSGDLTEKEKRTIDKVMPVKRIKTLYNPLSVDDIKFDSSFNDKVIIKDRFNYLKIYLSLVRKNFGTAVESYLISTIGYWYPDIDTTYIQNNIYQNNLNITNENNKFSNNIFNSEYVSNIVLIKSFFSVGLCVWLVIILFVFITIKNFKKIIYLLPSIILIVTLLLATPDYGEIRYILGIIYTLPLLFGIILNDKVN